MYHHTRFFPHFVVTALVVAIGLFLLSLGPVYAHRSGCHRWHSCDSDSGSYTCGDLGYYTYCSGGSTSQPTQPNPSVQTTQPKPSVQPTQPSPSVQPTHAVNLTATVATDVLNVRQEPSITSAIIGQSYRNEVVTLIARTSDSEWVQRLDKGWLYRPLLTVNGGIEGIPALSPAMPTPISTVMLVSAPTNAVFGNVIDVAKNAPQLEILLLALQLSNLTDKLKGTGPFTLFAPVDTAFANLPEKTLDSLLYDTALLARVLQFHVVAHKLTAANITDGMTVDTLMGYKLTFAISGGKVTVNGSNVYATELPASNGSVFLIDSVLLPDTSVP